MVPLSRSHPAVKAWFSARLGEPTPAQRDGWGAIGRGEHTLIAAPTGSGKTLAAFLSAINTLVEAPARDGALNDETSVLYLSPLKALARDVQKNLDGPLAEIRALDPTLPVVRTMVRTGDTKAAERAAMLKKPPHILVTTPESLYVLLTSDGGRRTLRSVRTVIVDEMFATEASREPKTVMRGRLEALGPVVSDDPVMLALEAEGHVLRGRFEGREGWCSRRLLARIHRYTLESLRKEIEPVTATEFLRYLAAYQHVDAEHRLEGPRGVLEAIRQLAGFELPAVAWEASVLPARVRGYKKAWLDTLTLSGDVAWGRLWGSGQVAIRTTPLCLIPRDELDLWTSLARPCETSDLGAAASAIEAVLRARGALFPREVMRRSGLSGEELDEGLGQLVAAGIATCDPFGSLRALTVPSGRKWLRESAAGRWSFFRMPRDASAASASEVAVEPSANALEMVARKLLVRTGVVFRKTLGREKLPIPWRDLARVYRTLEARGEVRGGRFVAGFDGEQYALPEAVTLLRAIRRRGAQPQLHVSAADPLNLRGILTPDERVPPAARKLVLLA